jgi:hypothetical protein
MTRTCTRSSTTCTSASAIASARSGSPVTARAA